MTIDSVQNGIVIDHIPVGRAMQLYQALELDKVDCSVAILKNVTSEKLGKKDIIKIDAEVAVNFDIIGYLAPGCTINEIKNGEKVRKYHPSTPDRLVGIIKCKNPRCITTIEQELTQTFILTNREKNVYRCIYCEAKAQI